MSRLRSLRKIDILGYLLVLMGLNFVTEYGPTLVAGSASFNQLGAVGGTLFGVVVVAAGVYFPRHPTHEDETKPAPRYLYGLATIATVAFVVLLLLRFAGL